MWYFEAVEDRGQLVAIRQLTVEADGTRHRYWADRLEDDWGFLTDQPLAPQESDGLEAVSAEQFRQVWGDDLGD
jgi:hypothetical protein